MTSSILWTMVQRCNRLELSELETTTVFPVQPIASTSSTEDGFDHTVGQDIVQLTEAHIIEECLHRRLARMEFVSILRLWNRRNRLAVWKDETPRSNTC